MPGPLGLPRVTRTIGPPTLKRAQLNSDQGIAMRLHPPPGHPVWLAVAAWAAVLCLLLGCDDIPSESGPLGSAPTTPSEAGGGLDPAEGDAAEPAGSTASEPIWDAVYIQGKKAGHARTQMRQVVVGDRRLLETEQQLEFAIRRGEQRIQQKLKLTSRETAVGELVDLKAVIFAGNQPVVLQGEVEGGALSGRTESAGRTQRWKIPWPAGGGSFFADVNSLRRNPLQPGETREVVVATPGVSGVAPAATQLRAIERAETDVLGQKRKLLRVEAEMTLSGSTTPLKSTLWVDDAGEVLKADLPLGQTTYRTSREFALADDGGGEFDINALAMLPLQIPSRAPHATTALTYTVQLDGLDPAEHFVSDNTQRLVAAGDRVARIQVIAVRPDTELPDGFAVDRQPGPGDRQANSLIQSDDPRVRRMAAAAALDERDPWKVAIALESVVEHALDWTEFSPAFASAAEAAGTGKGDCTEHAVLLAALLRARKIPARVATGLVYVPQRKAMGFHMWTEAWIHDRWVPLDATLGRGGIGAAHLKVTTTDLADGESVSAFLSVVQLLGNLKLSVESGDR